MRASRVCGPLSSVEKLVRSTRRLNAQGPAARPRHFSAATRWLAVEPRSCGTLRGAQHGQTPGSPGTPRFRSLSTSQQPSAPPFAFAFDIDGVLLHVDKPIPGAAEALAYLHAHHVPFILLTNGGGRHEEERVADLSRKLGVPLSVDNFVQSHTPFRDFAARDPSADDGGGGGPGLADKTILVTGSDAQASRGIAERYGFRSVVTPADILVAEPGVWPFDPLLEPVYRATARPLPRPLWRPGVREEEALKVDAVFVFNDPRDWALDTQLIVDLLLSRRGYLGTYSAANGRDGRWQDDGQPDVFFSNPDLWWATGYRLPRFGQGAFQAAVAGVWSRVTGGEAELRARVFGKPHRATYAFAERVLERHRAQMLKRQGAREDAQGGGGERARLRSVYMVGDNPDSDIAGANAFRGAGGADWCSVLVRTGVWDPARGEPSHRPRIIVDDVKAAVRWAFEREGWGGRI